MTLRRACLFLLLLSVVLLIASVDRFAPVPLAFANDVPDPIVGTDQSDIIVVGPLGRDIGVGNGDDLIIGGPGDNTYVIDAGYGHITVLEVEGNNIVEFGPGITFSDVAGGLWITGDDLRLTLGSQERSLTIRDFFKVRDTISLFRFDNGQQLEASQLFSVFGRTPPEQVGVARTLITELDVDGVLRGTDQADVLVPVQPVSRVDGQQGADILIGRTEPLSFEFSPGYGQNLIIASSGGHEVLFRSGISFNDVASQLQKSGDDLILGNQGSDGEVRIHGFFAHANLVSRIRFESGGEIGADQLYGLFGLATPENSMVYALNVEGVLLDHGEGTTPPGDGDDGGDDGGDQGGDQGGDPGDGDPTPDPDPERPDDLNVLRGTAANDVLFVGPGDNLVAPGRGDDFIIGGPGDNYYLFDANDGHNTLFEVEGRNIIEFGSGISYADIAGGLVRNQASGSLELRADAKGLRVTIAHFFTSAETVEELRFHSGERLTSAQLWQIFSEQPPAASGSSASLVLGRGDSDVVSAEASASVVVPRMANQTVQAGSGDDFLIGSRRHYNETLIFRIVPGNGHNTLLSDAGDHQVLFAGGIDYSDIASNIRRVGDNLVLHSEAHDAGVTLHRFFAQPAMIHSIRFEDGNSLHASELFSLFEVVPPESDQASNLLLRSGVTESCYPRSDQHLGVGFDDEGSNPADNTPPTIVSQPELEVDSDTSYVYQVRASDAENHDLCYSLEAAPDGASIVAHTGDLTFTPTRSQIGSRLFDIRVVDEHGAVGHQTFELQVLDPNTAPIIRSQPWPEAVVGQQYRYSIQATDPYVASSRLSYHLISGPQGMLLQERQLDWTPGDQDVGLHEIELEVRDPFGLSASQVFELTVVPITTLAELEEGVSRIPRTGVRHSGFKHDDADLRIGTLRVFERDDQKEVVFDRVNGLVWQDNAAVLDSSRTIGSARVFCRDLNLAGLDDWRLPNRLELVFLLQHYRENANNHFIDDAFQQVGHRFNSQWFLAENWPTGGRINGWNTMVDFFKAEVLPADHTQDAHVRCVSGEPMFLPELHKPQTQEITVDRNNRLMWQDDPAVLETRGSLEEALGYCEALELGGHDDWRLPNFNESQILAREFDYFVKDHPSWPSRHIHQVPDERYWHSSTLLTGNHRPLSQSAAARHFQFRYQYDPATNYAGSWYHNLNTRAVSSSLERPVRCIRSYAEPSPVVLHALPEELDIGEIVRLDGSASYHSDGQIVRYQWKDLSTEQVLGEEAVLDVSFDTPGERLIQLTVWDQHGLEQSLAEPHAVTIFGAPEVVIEAPASVWEGESIVLDASASADDSGIVDYNWIDLNDGSHVGSEPVLELPGLESGTWQFELTVTNARGLSANQQVAIEVKQIPPPIIQIEGETVVWEAERVILDATASSDLFGIDRFKWVLLNNGELLGDDPVLELDGLQAGEWDILLTVTNLSGRSTSEQVSVSVALLPELEVLGERDLLLGEAVNLSISANQDLSATQIEWRTGDSDDLLADGPALELDYLPIGEHPIVLVLTDPQGRVYRKQLSVSVAPHAPVIVLEDAVELLEGESYLLDASASYVPYGEIQHWRWYRNDDPQLLAESAKLELESLAAGVWHYRLEIESDAGLSVSQSVEVRVAFSFELCPFVPRERDDDYVALYPDRNLEWRGGDAETVEDIARAFNYARSQDPSVFQYLIMPDQATWDSWSIQQKGLYLVNAERVARGIKPYAGYDPALVTAAESYAEFIRDNNMVIDHYADGRSPMQRMDAQPYVADHRDRRAIKTESLSSGTHLAMPGEDEALARAIFFWLYQDKDWFVDFDWADGPPWGHRDHLLQTELDENHGSPYAEGLVGFGVSLGHYAPGRDPSDRYGYVTAFKTLDQGPDWDEARISTVDVSRAQGCNSSHRLQADLDGLDLQGLQSIRIAPDSLIMTPGSQAFISVLGVFEDGSERDLSAAVSHQGDHLSVVQVAGQQLTALRAGNARVFVRLAGLESNHLRVHVREATRPEDSLQNTAADALAVHVPDNASIAHYDPLAVAAYTGLVNSRHGQPLPGVQVSFLNRPELGSVRTDADGRFMITGPAGRQTLIYEKPGHLVVQRGTIAGSNKWATLPTVTLLARDSKRSFIDLAASEPQVHSSSLISDEAGQRRATVVFNNIPGARVVSVDGRERELQQFWFSATEYETPESMPGALPAETAFTFANDLHVDGVHYSDTVLFDSPVVMFIDNFLGFEVGEIIPIGYFDRLADEWVASPNGIVVRVLDQNGDGQPDGLDYTGDGQANDLNGSGITADDAIGLAEAGYQAGDTLWWGSFDHMTPYDYNLAPSDAEAPTELDVDADLEDPDNTEETCTGSFGKPNQQTFHEAIPVAGTNMALHYNSQRTAGYQHRFRVRASGASVPDSLEAIVVRLEIGGHVFERNLPPEPNQETLFYWDGRNVDGSRSRGEVSGRVSIGYEYAGVFMSAGNAAEEDRPLEDFPVAWATLGDRSTAVPGRESFISWQSNGVSVRNSFERQLAEGWSLSGVHEFDRSGRVYLGTGDIREVPAQSLILRTGQTFSHVPGDDGDYQSGGSNIDYRISDQGTLLDRVTGLEWEYRERPQRFRTRPEASAYCALADDLPGEGWRLPTAKEVGYTIHKAGGNIGPAIYSQTQARQLWRTSTANPEQNLLPVLCVRGESINDRYVRSLRRDAGNQVVVDTANGLMWQDSPENASLKLDWRDSIQHCESSQHAGHDDWRLPNINELLYVLPNDVFEHQTTLDWPAGAVWDHTAAFRQVYWSSISNNQNDAQAWGIESESFNSPMFNKADSYHLRCVRDASSSARMPYRFDSDGLHRETIELDSGATLSTMQYTHGGRIASITDRFGDQVRIEAANDPHFSRSLRIIAPHGERTHLSIDEAGYLREIRYEDNTSYLFDYQSGGLLSVKTDPNGHQHRRDYNSRGRLLSTRDPEGGEWSFFDEYLGVGHSRYGYATAEGLLYQSESRRLPSGATQRLTTHYDGTLVTRELSSDRLLETQTACGVETVTERQRDFKTGREVPQRITITQPSGLSNVTEVAFEYAENGADTTRYTVTGQRDGRTSQLSVDARAGRLTHTSPTGRTVTEFSDPQTLLPQSLEIPGLHSTTYEHDSRGRLIAEHVGERSVHYAYDQRGNLATITAADQRETHYQYDQLGRVTAVIYPDGNTALSEYDAAGNQTTLVVPTPADYVSTFNRVDMPLSDTTPLDETTQYVYDKDQRLTAIELPDGERIEHHYGNGQLLRTDTPEGEIEFEYLCGGRASSVQEGGERVDYEWDGSLLTSLRYSGELNEAIEMAYNSDFAVTSQSYAGKTTSRTYDADGMLASVGDFTLSRHDEHGLVTGLSDDRFSQTWQYNGHAEPLHIKQGVDGAARLDTELVYNTVGQIVEKIETLADGSIRHYQYDYDQRRRLIEVVLNGERVEHYAYDANGSRTLTTSVRRGLQDVSASYNHGDQLQQFGNTQYQYDSNGRLSRAIATTAQGERQTDYHYSSMGRLLQVQTPEADIEYRYSALGNRVAKLIDGEVVERYLWQDKTTLLATYDGSGRLKQRFEYVLGHVPSKFTQDGSSYYIITDHLGSPRLITDAQGQVQRAIDYDAYGNIVADSNPSLRIPFGFAGGLYDADTGLVRFGYRDYDPHTGRWTARDPIGFAGGDSNLYGYVHGDPINFIDPLGLWRWGDPLPQWLVDGSAAFGDAISFGATDAIRERMGTNNVVDKCSGAYAVGEIAGSLVGPNKGRAGAGVAARVSGGSRGRARNPANRVNLNKQLGSQQQLGETGVPVAGAGTNTRLRDSNRLANEHGGNASDWAKRSSSQHRAPDGRAFETHWYENGATGQRVEPKTIIEGYLRGPK